MSGPPLVLAGRYNKYSRTISQTPWFVDGDRKVADSVEEFISGACQQWLPHRQTKFLACGREDVDVQMLGLGRPFAVELSGLESGQTSADRDLLRQVERAVAERSAGRVQVRDLQPVARRDMARFLKDEEADKDKSYRAVCCCSRPLSVQTLDRVNAAFRPMTLQQETPIRVLHRRPLVGRSRRVLQLRLQPLRPAPDARLFVLSLTVESGTYIKEFVHGDLGRTTPCLSDLIGDCSTDILTLDVEEVCVDWPPAIPDSRPESGD